MYQPVPSFIGEAVKVGEIDESAIFRPTLMDHIQDLQNNDDSVFVVKKAQKWLSPY